jgi:hypothetical protein
MVPQKDARALVFAARSIFLIAQQQHALSKWRLAVQREHEFELEQMQTQVDEDMSARSELQLLRMDFAAVLSRREGQAPSEWHGRSHGGDGREALLEKQVLVLQQQLTSLTAERDMFTFKLQEHEAARLQQQQLLRQQQRQQRREKQQRPQAKLDQGKSVETAQALEKSLLAHKRSELLTVSLSEELKQTRVQLLRMAKAKQSLELIAAEAMGASNHVCAQAVQMKAEKEKANVMAMAALREVVMLKEKIVQMQQMQRPSFDSR